MKKFLAILLAGVMMLSFAACGEKEPQTDDIQESTQAPVASVSPVDALASAWSAYAEEEKFMAMGGDMNNIVDGAPGKFDISDAAALDATLAFPEAAIPMIDEAASLVHGMMANNFTAGAFNVADAANVDAVAKAIEENIQGRQWICGWPETMLIVKNGSTVVSAFGAADLIENFKTKLLAANEGATVVVEGAIEF